MSELKPCPFCVSEAGLPTNLDGTPVDYEVTDCTCKNDDCPISEYWIPIKIWQSRPIEDKLRKRVAELEAAQRWIPVSERLPEDRATILAAFKNREILTATYYKRYEGFGGVENYWHIEGWHSGNVTHWMPLPELPIVYGKEREE